MDRSRPVRERRMFKDPRFGPILRSAVAFSRYAIPMLKIPPLKLMLIAPVIMRLADTPYQSYPSNHAHSPPAIENSPR